MDNEQQVTAVISQDGDLYTIRIDDIEINGRPFRMGCKIHKNHNYYKRIGWNGDDPIEYSIVAGDWQEFADEKESTGIHTSR